MKTYRIIVPFALSLLAAGCATSSQPIAADRLQNIQKAAVEIAEIQQKNGANGAFTAIAKCYQQELAGATTLTLGIESCMAQDIIVTKVSADFFLTLSQRGPLPPGTPDPERMKKEMAARVAGTFIRFGAPASEGAAFAQAVNKQGMEAYAHASFPQQFPLPSNQH